MLQETKSKRIYHQLVTQLTFELKISYAINRHIIYVSILYITSPIPITTKIIFSWKNFMILNLLYSALSLLMSSCTKAISYELCFLLQRSSIANEKMRTMANWFMFCKYNLNTEGTTIKHFCVIYLTYFICRRTYIIAAQYFVKYKFSNEKKVLTLSEL
jgi:hypothetical protein